MLREVIGLVHRRQDPMLGGIGSRIYDEMQQAGSASGFERGAHASTFAKE